MDWVVLPQNRLLNTSLKRSESSTEITKSTILPSRPAAGSLGGIREEGAIRADVLGKNIVKCDKIPETLENILVNEVYSIYERCSV
jgi:hypothetical protein